MFLLNVHPPSERLGRLFSVAFPSSQARGDFFESFLGGSINVEDQLTRSTIKPAGHLIQMWLSIFKKKKRRFWLSFVLNGPNATKWHSQTGFAVYLFSLSSIGWLSIRGYLPLWGFWGGAFKMNLGSSALCSPAINYFPAADAVQSHDNKVNECCCQAFLRGPA